MTNETKSLIETAMHLLRHAALAEEAAKAAKKAALAAIEAEGISLNPGESLAVANGKVLATKAKEPEMVAIPAMHLSTAIRDGLVKPVYPAMVAAFPEAVKVSEVAGPVQFRPDRTA